MTDHPAKPIRRPIRGEVTDLGAVELAAAVRARRISSREVVQAHLDRIETVNPRVNAVVALLAEQALHAADAADEAVRAGAELGPLHGVPFSVKEGLDVAGTPTTDGVRAFAGAVPSIDAPAVANLRASGAIVIARTNLADFALRWHTESELHGATRNPIDPAVTPGGSSGGDAVAVATGMVAFGVGHDMGGSVRWPAQCNGVAALKPSFGRIPDARDLQPTEQPLSGQFMAVAGPIARSVSDLRTLLAVMSRPSARDPWHVPHGCDVPALRAPVRVALAARPPGAKCAPEVERAVRWAGNALADAGYIVEEIEPPDTMEVAQLWVRILVAALVPVWDEQLRPHCSPNSRRFIEDAMTRYPLDPPEAQYSAWMERQALARKWSLFMERYPLVLTPVSMEPPFAVGADLEPGAITSLVSDFRYLLPANVLGLPALTVPVRRAGKRPQAVQLIGRYLHEAACLDAGAALERAGLPTLPVDPVPGEP